MTRVFLTTTIPYVNGPPHLGFALEAVQADVLARHHRRLGDQVRLQTGTDENSLKNVLAAEAAGVPVRDWVDRHAAAIAGLREPLALSYDDFLRTSADPRHLAGVERLWQACAAAGDLYKGWYEGLYCVGCESYYPADELPGGRCPEHGTEPVQLAEENWFFRLSRYAGQVQEAIRSGALRIVPEQRRNEVLALIETGLRDISISRSRERARGWGLPVPGDPGQVIYVWWDALGNYVTSLDSPEAYQRWWAGGDRRIHLVGKGVLRFHAVYWPALLLSAGLPLPTDIVVHDYLTIDGRKLSKSTGGGADPAALVARYGTDAVRWWLLREVPRIGDVDFTAARLVARADADLAGGIGNLVKRVVTLVHRCADGRVPDQPAPEPLAPDAPALVAAAIAGFDFRRACDAVWTIVDESNRYLERVRPWQLARTGSAGPALATLVAACRILAEQLSPFLPGAAEAIANQLTPGEDGRLPAPRHLFRRLAPPAATRSAHRVNVG